MSGVKHTPVTPFTPGHLYFDDPTWDQKIALRGRKTVYGQPYVVAHVNRPGSARLDDDKRYARLFCAAPDLLSVAIKSHEPYEGLSEEDIRSVYGLEEAKLAIALRDAITRATGDRPEKGGAL